MKLLKLLWLFAGVVGSGIFAVKLFTSFTGGQNLLFPYAEAVDFSQISPVAAVGIIYCRMGYLISWTCSIPALVAQWKQFGDKYCYRWMLYSLVIVSGLSATMLAADFLLNAVLNPYPTKTGSAYGISDHWGPWPLSMISILSVNFLLLFPGMLVYPFQFLYDRSNRIITTISPEDRDDEIETRPCPECGEGVPVNDQVCPMCGMKMTLEN